MLVAAKAAGQITKIPVRNRSHIPNENMCIFTLEELGIDRKLSMRSQQATQSLFSPLAAPCEDLPKNG
jgi:hypothetical protein